MLYFLFLGLLLNWYFACLTYTHLKKMSKNIRKTSFFMLVNRWTILEEHIDIVIVVDSVNLKVVKNQGTDLEAIPNLEGVYSIVPRKSLPGHGMQI